MNRTMRLVLVPVLAVISMLSLTACPEPLDKLIERIRNSLIDPTQPDLIDCSILIGMPSLPTLAHPATNTGVYKVVDERFAWEVWAPACAGRINVLKIETGGNGGNTGPWLDAVLWPFSQLSWWGTWTTWQEQFMHPRLNMSLWSAAYIVARPLGF